MYRLEESGVLTDCSIQTRDADETLDFDFTSANVINKIIMKAECLREAFAELDMSSDVIEILLSPSPPYFRLTTFGYAGTTQVRNYVQVYMWYMYMCAMYMRCAYTALIYMYIVHVYRCQN